MAIFILFCIVCSMNVARLSLAGTAAAFAGFGIALLVKPDLLSKVDIELRSDTARAEVRAMYGGMEIGLAVFFALCATKRKWHRPGLWAQTAGLGGLSLGRTLGIALSAERRPLLLALLAAEGLAAVTGAVTLKQIR
jgi:Domain of unknown function (DUF4345)